MTEAFLFSLTFAFAMFLESETTNAERSPTLCCLTDVNPHKIEVHTREITRPQASRNRNRARWRITIELRL